MELHRGIILILVITAMTTLTIPPCFSGEKKADGDFWIKDEPGGPGGGPGRGGRGPGRYRTREEDIDRFLKELKESDPKRAKELASLREKNPEKFREEFRKTVREQWSKRIESWRNKWREEFLEWLQKAVPDVAQGLADLKDTDTDLYAKKFEIIRDKYRHPFDESRRNPELAEILLAELELDERQEALVKKIKATENEPKKKELMAQLEEVVSNKYDLIIRKRIIAYEFLLKRVKELQKELSKNREEITKWKDDKIKAQNVKERIKELTEKSNTFRWR